MRKFFGSDKLGTVFPVPAGSARIEPGLPAEDVTLTFPTWTFFETVRYLLSLCAHACALLRPQTHPLLFALDSSLVTACCYAVVDGCTSGGSAVSGSALLPCCASLHAPPMRLA